MQYDLSIVKKMENKKYIKKRVWDLPTRFFHWALAGTVFTGWYLGEYRDFSTIYLHFYFGYAAGLLIVLRVFCWVFAPTNSGREELLPGFRKTIAYAKTIFNREPSGVAGHNPLGALSVLAMLLVILAQVITGLFSEDDTMFSSGPFSSWVDSTSVVTMTAFHYWISRILITVIGLHVFAVLFYRFWKHEDLIKPMITGVKCVKNQKH